MSEKLIGREPTQDMTDVLIDLARTLNSDADERAHFAWFALKAWRAMWDASPVIAGEREALEFYADPISYALTQAAEPRSAVHGDNGRRAREALALAPRAPVGEADQ